MHRFGSGKLMFLGFFLLVLGVVLPFLMVLKMIESTLFLGFFSYLISFAGLVLGIVGVINYGQIHRRDKD